METVSIPIIQTTNDNKEIIQKNNFNKDLLTMVQTQLEFYFSRENLLHDKYLTSQMDNDNYVSLSIISSFNMVKKIFSQFDNIISLINDDNELSLRLKYLVEAVQISDQLQIDQTLTKVRAASRRCVLILRDIDKDTPIEEVTGLFDNQQCSVRCLGCEFAGNKSWYITFKNEQEAHIGVQFLKEKVQTFKGETLFARIKTQPIPRIDNVNNNNNNKPPLIMTNENDIYHIKSPQIDDSNLDLNKPTTTDINDISQSPIQYEYRQQQQQHYHHHPYQQHSFNNTQQQQQHPNPHNWTPVNYSQTPNHLNGYQTFTTVFNNAVAAAVAAAAVSSSSASTTPTPTPTTSTKPSISSTDSSSMTSPSTPTNSTSSITAAPSRLPSTTGPMTMPPFERQLSNFSSSSSSTNKQSSGQQSNSITSNGDPNYYTKTFNNHRTYPNHHNPKLLLNNSHQYSKSNYNYSDPINQQSNFTNSLPQNTHNTHHHSNNHPNYNQQLITGSHSAQQFHQNHNYSNSKQQQQQQFYTNTNNSNTSSIINNNNNPSPNHYYTNYNNSIPLSQLSLPLPSPVLPTTTVPTATSLMSSSQQFYHQPYNSNFNYIHAAIQQQQQQQQHHHNHHNHNQHLQQYTHIYNNLQYQNSNNHHLNNNNYNSNHYHNQHQNNYNNNNSQLVVKSPSIVTTTNNNSNNNIATISNNNNLQVVDHSTTIPNGEGEIEEEGDSTHFNDQFNATLTIKDPISNNNIAQTQNDSKLKGILNFTKLF
jgi:la-related protein 4